MPTYTLALFPPGTPPGMGVSAVSGRGDVDRKTQQTSESRLRTGRRMGVASSSPEEDSHPQSSWYRVCLGRHWACVSRLFPTGTIVDEETQQTVTPQVMMVFARQGYVTVKATRRDNPDVNP